MSIAETYQQQLNELEVPCKRDYTVYNVMNIKTGEFVHTGLSESDVKALDMRLPSMIGPSDQKTRENGDYLVIRCDDGIDQFKKDYKKFCDAKHQIMDDFKNHLITASSFGYEIGDIIFSKAWEDGHSSGLGEVEQVFDDYDELVSQAIAAYKTPKGE